METNTRSTYKTDRFHISHIVFKNLYPNYWILLLTIYYFIKSVDSLLVEIKFELISADTNESSLWNIDVFVVVCVVLLCAIELSRLSFEWNILKHFFYHVFVVCVFYYRVMRLVFMNVNTKVSELFMILLLRWPIEWNRWVDIDICNLSIN